MDYFFPLFIIAYVVVGFVATSHGIRELDATNDSSFNVLTYGAVGDGKHDDSQAFSKAWAAVCEATGENPTLLVPGDKIFLLTPIAFKGPCKSSVHVQIDGKLVAPDSIEGWGSGCQSGAWLTFEKIDKLLLDGEGELDGRGSIWWGKVSPFADDLHAIPINNGNGCTTRPSALALVGCNGLQLKGLTHKDSPQAHIKVAACDNSIISNLHISAPEDSPNTDGIDISHVTQLQILDSDIATGDDCIAIGSPSSWINITGITCGPGHGISVGSLGHDGEKAEVEEIHVRNCTFKKTTNGARIKTWQGGSGYARKITFEDIPLIDVKNPLIIDQYYCGKQGGSACQTQPNAVAVSEVTYSGFQGTSASIAAITLNCSHAISCTNIVLNNVDITPAETGQQLQAVCQNVKYAQTSVQPPLHCGK